MNINIRSLTRPIALALMLMGVSVGASAWAQSDFNPADPAEPGVPQVYTDLTLIADPADGGSVSGGGRSMEQEVQVYASANTRYKFVNWTRTDGTVVSTEWTFNYTKVSAKDTLIAHFLFDPTSASEPGNPHVFHPLIIVGDDGCSSVAGGGRYETGTEVTVNAYLNSRYDFVSWTNTAGEVVADTQWAQYIMPDHRDTLFAHTRFNPSAPIEPAKPNMPYTLTVTCSDGGYYYGTYSTTPVRVMSGTSFYLSARAEHNYDFVGWYLDGEFYTSMPEISCEMAEANMNFYARFIFNPGGPAEPPMAAIGTYSYYLSVKNTTPGSDLMYPIYLSNKDVVKDLTIQLTFPGGIEPSLDEYKVSSKAEGYSISLSEVEDNISILEEGARIYNFTFVGGTIQPGIEALLTFKVHVPETVPAGTGYQIKINQISMQQADGTRVTAHTRNGLIGVYNWGDTNGDGNVNIGDLVTYRRALTDQPVSNFVPEAADVDHSNTIDDADVEVVAGWILEGE